MSKAVNGNLSRLREGKTNWSKEICKQHMRKLGRQEINIRKYYSYATEQWNILLTNDKYVTYTYMYVVEFEFNFFHIPKWWMENVRKNPAIWACYKGNRSADFRPKYDKPKPTICETKQSQLRRVVYVYLSLALTCCISRIISDT